MYFIRYFNFGLLHRSSKAEGGGVQILYLKKTIFYYHIKVYLPYIHVWIDDGDVDD